MNKSEFFTSIADTIEEYGWTQYHAGTEEWGFCVYGAARHQLPARREMPDLGERGKISAERDKWLEEFAKWVGYGGNNNFLTPLIAPWLNTLISWNDAKGRTKEEVVLNLRKYAEEVAGE